MDNESGALRSTSDRAVVNGAGQAVSAVPASVPSAFAFGDEEWPGIAKLAEECGEVVQVIGKLMMTHGSPAHWSGNLREMLVEEMADVQAAVSFVARYALTEQEAHALYLRAAGKMVKFEGWHADMDADPPPPLSAQGMETRQGGDAQQAPSHCDDSPVPQGCAPATPGGSNE